jgi:hypothetical protein
LIRIKDRHFSSRIKCLQLEQEVIMPFDATLVSVGVAIMFLAFAGVLLWGDLQTRPDRLKADSQAQKRRSF